MAGKYELYTDKSGAYRFRLKASNGQVVASSESYSTKTAAQNGIASVRRTPTPRPSTSPELGPGDAPT